MSDLISRQAAISAICNACGKIDCDKMDKCEKLQLPPASCSEFPNSSDTISRQEAINALNKLKIYRPLDSDRYVISDCLNKIVNLPSAQPEIEERKEESAQNVLKDDSVSRKAAIEALIKMLADCFQTDEELVDAVVTTIKDLPSAQPEIVRCKDCKYWREYKYVNGKPKYLPYCGFNDIYFREDDYCSHAERREG